MIRTRLAIALAASLALAACGPSAPPRSAGAIAAEASDTVDQVQASYDAAKAFVDLFLPFVPAARAEQIRKAALVVEDALRRARLAATAAQRAAALIDAQRAIASYQLTSGG